MCNIIFLTCACLWDVQLERHCAHFLGHVKAQSPISAQENPCYRGITTVLELCGSLFISVIFYRNLWQCKRVFFQEKLSHSKNHVFFPLLTFGHLNRAGKIFMQVKMHKVFCANLCGTLEEQGQLLSLPSSFHAYLGKMHVCFLYNL